jgi:soluble lytic murein transglycosylase-like protein
LWHYRMVANNHKPTPSSRKQSRDDRSTGVMHNIKHKVWIALTGALLVLCGALGFAGTLAAASIFNATVNSRYQVIETNHPYYAQSPVGPGAADSSLSPVFTPQVQYWAPIILAWGVVHQIDPNLIATVIQIESCGDPYVSSPAGAQGLFQVMPFHFSAGEDMLDVQTNALRGLTYLARGLELADGHAGLALAGYNGGHGVIKRGWATWAAETQRYYYWGTRIYEEAVSGMTTSPTLDEWLNAGGRNLCSRASQSQQRLDREQASTTALTSN